MTSVAKPGAAPGLHALVVGVSAYSNLPLGPEDGPEALLGLRQLQSPALTAYRIARWLRERQKNLPVPLASCRVLVAPSEVELAVEPELAGVNPGCTFEQFASAAAAWRDDASTHRDNVTLFYFAGHGAERSRQSHVMLMQDFGTGAATFGRAVDTRQLIDGMVPAPDWPAIALTQLYFVDACRIRPRFIRKLDDAPTGPLWNVPAADVDDRSVSIFYAAAPGRTAYARKGEQTVFSAALLDCLNREGAEREPTRSEGRSGWRVSIHSLARTLEVQVRRRSAAIKKVQRARPERLGSDAPLHFLDGPPDVDVQFAVDPPDASKWAHISVADQNDEPVRSIPAPVTPHPYSDRFPAGVYVMRARIDPPTPPFVSRQRPILIGLQEPRLVTVPVGPAPPALT